MCHTRAALAVPPQRKVAAPLEGRATEARASVTGVALALCAVVGYTALQLRAVWPRPQQAVVPSFFFAGNAFALPAAVTSAYLAGCFVGPRLMAGRAALPCKAAMLVYNFYQAVFNAVCVAVLVSAALRHRLAPWGNVQTGPWHDRGEFADVAAVVWLHYNNKYVELLDSVFMVLRKKESQLSFLHVYHHALLIWAWWYVMHSGGCVDTFFGSGCNAAIHVAMYSYYAASALGVACPWKRYLTVAQLGQFCCVAAQSVAVLLTPATHCPASLPLAQLFVMCNMLVLFGRFYAKSYSPKAGKKSA